MILLVLTLILSLTINGVLIWYCRKLVKNLWNGFENLDDLHTLLLQYSSYLEQLYKLDEFYGDETIKMAIDNTKIIVEACRTYKQSIIQQQEQNSDQEKP